MTTFFSSESVTEGHPDKVCDQIADAILDALLEKDPHSHVACEVTAITDAVHIFGEITSAARVDYEAIAQKGYLNPFYNYGAMSIAIPGWALGTFFGVLMGDILPSRIVSALSVCLYGMFLAIIIPPAKQNKVVAGTVIIAFVTSFAFATLPLLKTIPEGMRVIILTVAISLLAAIFFPVKEDEDDE